MHVCDCLRRILVAKGTGFNLSKNYALSGTEPHYRIDDTITSQPVDGPLFKLLEFDLGGRRVFIEAQSMGVVLLLVLGNSELLLFMIFDVTSS